MRLHYAALPWVMLQGLKIPGQPACLCNVAAQAIFDPQHVWLHSMERWREAEGPPLSIGMATKRSSRGALNFASIS